MTHDRHRPWIGNRCRLVRSSFVGHNGRQPSYCGSQRLALVRDSTPTALRTIAERKHGEGLSGMTLDGGSLAHACDRYVPPTTVRRLGGGIPPYRVSRMSRDHDSVAPSTSRKPQGGHPVNAQDSLPWLPWP